MHDTRVFTIWYSRCNSHDPHPVFSAAQCSESPHLTDTLQPPAACNWAHAGPTLKGPLPGPKTPGSTPTNTPLLCHSLAAPLQQRRPQHSQCRGCHARSPPHTPAAARRAGAHRAAGAHGGGCGVVTVCSVHSVSGAGWGGGVVSRQLQQVSGGCGGGECLWGGGGGAGATAGGMIGVSHHLPAACSMHAQPAAVRAHFLQQPCSQTGAALPPPPGAQSPASSDASTCCSPGMRSNLYPHSP